MTNHRKRIIVGPHAMRVECQGIKSNEIKISEADDTNTVRAKGQSLWQEIRPIVSWRRWSLHRMKMANQRLQASIISASWPGPYYAGPRADLIAVKPWRKAVHGEWASVPHGVAARLLRGDT